MAATFHELLIEENRDPLRRRREHPAVQQIVAGTIDTESFNRWLCQAYLSVREFERFLASLAARAPKEMRKAFYEALLNLHGVIEIYEEILSRNRVNPGGTRLNFGCHASLSYLSSTVHIRTFEEALASCYGSVLAFQDPWLHSWRVERAPGPWSDLLDLWAQDGLREWVRTLENFTDSAAERTTPAVREQMKEAFRIAIHYELFFWDWTFKGMDW